MTAHYEEKLKELEDIMKEVGEGYYNPHILTDKMEALEDSMTPQELIDCDDRLEAIREYIFDMFGH